MNDYFKKLMKIAADLEDEESSGDDLKPSHVEHDGDVDQNSLDTFASKLDEMLGHAKGLVEVITEMLDNIKHKKIPNPSKLQSEFLDEIQPIIDDIKEEVKYIKSVG